MSYVVRLLLPALFPSWRFFEEVVVSPRVQVLSPTGDWHEAMPQPLRLMMVEHLLRLFWNPAGNRRLFLTALAERLLAENDPMVRAQLQGLLGGARFRIVLISRDPNGGLREDIVEADPHEF